MMEAVEIYRHRFEPSKQLDRPYVMLGLNALVADTDAEARRQFTSVQQSFVNLRRGMPGQVPPPIDDIEAFWAPYEKAGVEQALACAIVGSPATVKEGLRSFVAGTGADELIVTCHIHDHSARLRSFELLAGVRDRL
jgi:luciferase family oxidoreductase group 1